MPVQQVEACSDPRVAASLEAALNELIAVDRDLFVVGVHERTIVARLAMHLQTRFPGWHVDCEYNREGHDPKEIDLPDGVTKPYPDLIVHRRRQVGRDGNLLVIELKLSSNPSLARELRDLLKLPAYIQSLGYRYAVFVKLDTFPREPRILGTRWFEFVPDL